jgi:Lrp/AsnC family leucine-responsive transcriptional regulator
MDRVDTQILNLLQDNAKLPQADIARQVGLSPAAVNERIRKLETQGAIRRYVAILDEEKIGCDVTAFIEVFVEHPRFERSFVDAMKALPEVQEVHHVTGEFSCLLKVKTYDRKSLKELLLERINALEGVRQTRTVIVLSTSKEETHIALRERAGGKEREALSF